MRKAFPLQWCNNLSQLSECAASCNRHATMRKPAHPNARTVRNITVSALHTLAFGPFVRK